MEKLPMCRICLAENVRMSVVVNKNLHEVYERLTDTPFVTDDSRPILACSFCCAKLKQCFRLLRKCLEAEEVFAQIMNGNYEPKPLINQDHLGVAHGFVISPIENTSIVEGQTESVVVKVELPDAFERQDDILEPKEEYQNDELELENLDNSRLDVKVILPHDFESDSGDYVPLIQFKIEEEDEPEASKEKYRAAATNCAPDARIPKLEDTITAKQKNIDLSDSIIIQKTEKLHVTGIKSRVHNSINNTYTKDNDGSSTSNNDLVDNKWKHKSIGDINRDVRLTAEENSFKCKICQCIFKTNYLLNRHIRIHAGEKSYKCDICQRSFSNSKTLSEHAGIHTGEKPFKCDICHSSFTQKNYLTVHMRVHSGEKPYKCDICHKSFRQKSDLTRHKRIHTGEKPFKCEICQCSFRDKSKLTMHMRVHSGEKPFECDICHWSFRQKNNLTAHIRIHTGEKPYKCDICQSSFREKSSLTNHMRFHTGEEPFKCDICHSSFKQKNNLTAHKRIHTGEKPYKCDICHSSFRQKTTLNTHMRVHSGEKPFECDVCQRSFREKSNLTKHRRVHSCGKTLQVSNLKTHVGRVHPSE